MPKNTIGRKKILNRQVRFVRPRVVIRKIEVLDLTGSLAEILVAICNKQVTEATLVPRGLSSLSADPMMHTGFSKALQETKHQM